MLMAEIKVKSLSSSLVNWEAYILKAVQDIKSLQAKIKDMTLDERDAMKELRKNLKVANWKRDSILALMREELDDGKQISGVITLDDFDVGDAEINIELTKKEFAEATKELSLIHI